MKIIKNFMISIAFLLMSFNAVASYANSYPNNNFADGSFEDLGSFLVDVQSANNSPTGIGIVDQWMQIISEPSEVLSTLWKISGDVQLISTGENSYVELTQSSDTSIGQLVFLDNNAEILQFDLTIITAGSDENLDVYFKNNLVGSFPLSSIANRRHSIPIIELAQQNGDFLFKLTGTKTEPAIIALDNLAIVGSVVALIVPNVIDLTQVAAETTITEAGLTVGNVTTANSETVLDGNVVSQNPASGSSVALDSKVDLVVSTGPAISITGDLDGDADVDRDDLNIILSARGTPATGSDDPRDLDGDGMITALDARKLTQLCTRPRCATE